VAWHLTALGADATLLSAVGNDVLGDTLKANMLAWGMKTNGVNTNQLPTGQVNVHIEQGEPRYEIAIPAAWDEISVSQVAEKGLLYYGSLALRSEHNKVELDKLSQTLKYARFVDINLRNPWWRKYDVLSLITSVDYVKMNIDEFHELGFMHEELIPSMKAIKQQFSIKHLLVTQGKQGATFLDQQGQVYTITPEVDHEITDTVGAGDAFSAMFIYGTLCGWKPELLMQQAQNFASLVVQNRGGVLLDKGLYTPFIHG
jgi:fructokinase